MKKNIDIIFDENVEHTKYVKKTERNPVNLQLALPYKSSSSSQPQKEFSYKQEVYYWDGKQHCNGIIEGTIWNGPDMGYRYFVKDTDTGKSQELPSREIFEKPF